MSWVLVIIVSIFAACVMIQCLWFVAKWRRSDERYEDRQMFRKELQALRSEMYTRRSEDRDMFREELRAIRSEMHDDRMRAITGARADY